MSDKEKEQTPGGQGEKKTDQPAEEKKLSTAEEQKVDLEAAKFQAEKDAKAAFAKELKEVTGVGSLEELKRQQLEKKGEFEKIAETEKEARIKTEAKYKAQIARSEVIAAASILNAADASDVFDLVRSKTSVEDDTVTIDGKSVKEYLTGFLKEKPYLVKASSKQGSGAKDTDTEKAEELKKQYDEAVKNGDVPTMLKLNALINKS